MGDMTTFTVWLLVSAFVAAVLLVVLIIAFQSGAYAECRHSWRTVDEYASVQDRCYERFIGGSRP